MTAAHADRTGAAEPPQVADSPPEAAAAEAPAANEDTPPPAAEAPAADDKVPARPALYRRVNAMAALAADRFRPLEKLEGGTASIARLAEPLLVQTSALVLASSAWDADDGKYCPHLYVCMPDDFEAFANQVEAAALRACLANKEDWFRRPADDRTIVAGFKQLCKASGHLKVELPPDAIAFDPAGEPIPLQALEVGTSVRCILRLDGIIIGRTECGAMWRVVQAQTRASQPPPPPPPRCLISSDEEEDKAPGGLPPSRNPSLHVHEFV